MTGPPCWGTIDIHPMDEARPRAAENSWFDLNWAFSSDIGREPLLASSLLTMRSSGGSALVATSMNVDVSWTVTSALELSQLSERLTWSGRRPADRTRESNSRAFPEPRPVRTFLSIGWSGALSVSFIVPSSPRSSCSSPAAPLRPSLTIRASSGVPRGIA